MVCLAGTGLRRVLAQDHPRRKGPSGTPDPTQQSKWDKHIWFTSRFRAEVTVGNIAENELLVLTQWPKYSIVFINISIGMKGEGL